ncbi:hypothetical protein [Xanthovirga aplysinae]|uniref:hypothetical protein n=1 Tax=Xanthovirga aplysinae TaxID=2529853 RepID=UPI0012BBB0A9|nr:hypothetical protein [Xanthovirga aplysinae]MTI30512.1 hypothetical protein [Xanthovirga aplysinae]
MLKVLLKTIGYQFYKVNGGFFLFLFLLLFGIVSPNVIVSYHFSIMQGVVSSPEVLALALIVWFLYGIKCLNFTLKAFDQPENIFLYNLIGLAVGRKNLILLFSQVFIYLPVLIYIILILGLAVYMGETGAFLIVLTYTMLFFTGSILIYNKKLINHNIIKNSFVLNTPIKISRKPSFLYLIFFTLHEKKLTFFGLKLFSFLILYLSTIASKEDLQGGLFLILYLLIALAHCILVFYYQQFMEIQMAFSRNLPISKLKRFFLYPLTYLLIFSPELTHMLTNSSTLIEWEVLLVSYMIGITQLTFLTSILYFKDLQMKKYIRIVFAIYILSVFLALSAKYLLIFLPLVLAVIIFYRNYDNYQLNANLY